MFTYRWHLIALWIMVVSVITTVDFSRHSGPHPEQLIDPPKLFPTHLNHNEQLYVAENDLLYNQKDLHCLVHNVFFEAGIDNTLGKIAVAQVTLNRVKVGRWGDSICDVVHSRGQFSWTNKSNLEIDHSSKNYKASEHAAKLVLEKGIRIKRLDSALFYHADYVEPHWIDKTHMIGRYGTHIFYDRSKGSWVRL